MREVKKHNRNSRAEKGKPQKLEALHKWPADGETVVLTSDHEEWHHVDISVYFRALWSK